MPHYLLVPTYIPIAYIPSAFTCKEKFSIDRSYIDLSYNLFIR